MKLTDEQREIVRLDENLMVSACPGSGKTRVMISKLVRLIDQLRGGTRSVACITYTNAGVDEIESRLLIHLQPGDDKYFDVCTIHSLCLNHIFRPFRHLIPGYEKGFQVLPAESEEFREIVTEVLSRFGRFSPRFADIEEFEKLRIDLDGNPAGASIEKGSLNSAMARAYWDAMKKGCYVDFAHIVYLSLVLLRKHPEILSGVSAKFRWILVDEFQDTTDLQTEILRLIASQGRTKFLFVGDSNQSIFGFAGARPELGPALAVEVGARQDLGLSGNFRSSKPIISLAEMAIARRPPMVSLGKFKDCTDEPVWVHGSDPFTLITDYFLPALEQLGIELGESAVLAPTWFTLYPLGRQLREYGIAVVGPGARPYRKSRHFVPLAELMCAYLLEPAAEHVVALEKALFVFVRNATERTRFDLFSYFGRQIVFGMIQIAKANYIDEIGAMAWLEKVAEEITQLLMDREVLAVSEKNILTLSVAEMKIDMQNNRVDTANLSIRDLGVYASPSRALKLTGLHSAKGREFDAVAMIDVHDGRIPSYYARTAEEKAEALRLFYVGVTRPRRYLMLMTDDVDRRNGPSPFLAQCGLRRR